MKSKFKNIAIVWGVIIVLFNVLIFVTPSTIASYYRFTTTFWIAYAFIMLSFFGHLAVSYYGVKDDNLNKLFLNVPLFHISMISVIVMGIVGTLCMVIPYLPYFVGIIVCVFVLGFSVIALTKAQTASSVVEEIDQKIKTKTFFIKALTVDMESLLSRCTSDDIKKEVTKVYEAVRYSDPMSVEALSGVESQITLKISELSEAVEKGDFDAVSKAAKEAVIFVEDRNKKCKLLK